MKSKIGLGLAVLALLLASLAAAADETPSLETRLNSFTRQLQLGVTLSSVAIHSPSLDDLHTHAQQLVNLIEGVRGAHFVRSGGAHDPTDGLLEEFTTIHQRIEESDNPAEVRASLFASSRNVRAYLNLALDSALLALEKRRLDHAVLEMMRTYAFLSAAYGRPCDAPYVPALWTILRAFNAEAPASPEDE